jgi:hypothetical protein
LQCLLLLSNNLLKEISIFNKEIRRPVKKVNPSIAKKNNFETFGHSKSVCHETTTSTATALQIQPSID